MDILKCKRLLFLLVMFILLFLVGCGSKVDSLTLSQTDLVLAVSESVKVTASISPEDLTDINIKWSSSDDKIATVDQEGVITGVSLGNATITVKAGNKKAKINVSVENKTFKVIFNTNEGSEINFQTVQYGAKATRPDNPTKEGYNFDGWYTAPNFEEEFDFNQGITSNTTIYAKWSIITYTISFETNGGTEIDAIEKAYGSKLLEADLATIPTKTGYEFDGWYVDEELTESVNLDEVITESFTLYAKWRPLVYTVEFETNQGSIIQSISINHGEKLENVEEPTRNGYVFAGWYLDSELTNAFDTDTAITSNLKLYAKWNPGQSKVTFVTNGGSEIAEVYVTTLQKLTKPTDPTRTNYLFAGWYTNSDLTDPYDFNDPVEGDLTLYAKWTLDPQYSHEIEFELNGGMFPISSTDSFIKTGTPILTSFANFAFNSSPWDNDLNKFYPYLQTTTATGSYWVKVGLSRNDVGVYTVREIVPSGSIDMSKYDYVISAWDQGDAYNFVTSLQIGQIITITGCDISEATPGLIQGEIRVYPAGSAYEEANTNLFLDDVNLPKPYKEGYRFLGWYKHADFSGEEVPKASEDGKLYAKWEEMEE